jgi:prepilin-type processing-associated H-X9-DG protein
MMNQENMMGEAVGWHVNIMLYDGHVASCLMIKQEPNNPGSVFVPVLRRHGKEVTTELF